VIYLTLVVFISNNVHYIKKGGYILSTKSVQLAVKFAVTVGIAYVIVFSVMMTGCGNGDDDALEAEIEQEIQHVITNRWQQGYILEDLLLYESAYWAEGFHYESNMGTPLDPSDDFVTDNLKDELECARVIFAQYQDIKIEISAPVVKLMGDTEALVQNHYKIQGFAENSVLTDGKHMGWYAEGDNEFTFEQRRAESGALEWRIAQWFDRAINPRDMTSVGITNTPFLKTYCIRKEALDKWER
jgi:hypothetical protein